MRRCRELAVRFPLFPVRLTFQIASVTRCTILLVKRGAIARGKGTCACQKNGDSRQEKFSHAQRIVPTSYFGQWSNWHRIWVRLGLRQALKQQVRSRSKYPSFPNRRNELAPDLRGPDARRGVLVRRRLASGGALRPLVLHAPPPRQCGVDAGRVAEGSTRRSLPCGLAVDELCTTRS